MLFSFWLGIKPVVIKYVREKRKQGRSRWTMRKKINLFIDSFLGFSTVPIKLASLVGLVVSLMSFCYGLFVFFEALFFKLPLPGFATVVCLLSFLSGVVIFMLSLIGEYLSRIYDEVTNKPEYVIDEVL